MIFVDGFKPFFVNQRLGQIESGNKTASEKQ
jgi:hypothetical protein